MQGRDAGGGVEQNAPMQRIPDDLIVNAQVEAAGVEAGMALYRQPGKGYHIEYDERPSDPMWPRGSPIDGEPGAFCWQCYAPVDCAV